MQISGLLRWVLFLLLVSVFLFVIFRQLREKKRAHLLLEQSFKQIAEQKIEIENQNKLVLQQKKKLTDSIFLCKTNTAGCTFAYCSI